MKQEDKVKNATSSSSNESYYRYSGGEEVQATDKNDDNVGGAPYEFLSDNRNQYAGNSFYGLESQYKSAWTAPDSVVLKTSEPPGEVSRMDETSFRHRNPHTRSLPTSFSFPPRSAWEDGADIPSLEAYRSAAVLPGPVVFQNSAQLPGLSSIEAGGTDYESMYPNQPATKSMPCLDEVQRCPELPGLSSVAMGMSSSAMFDDEHKPFFVREEPQTKSMTLPSFDDTPIRFDSSCAGLSAIAPASQINQYTGPETKSLPFGALPPPCPSDDDYIGISSIDTSKRSYYGYQG